MPSQRKFQVGDTVKCVSRLVGEEWLVRDKIEVGDELVIESKSGVHVQFFGKEFWQSPRNFKLVRRAKR